jgi:hypothetical protein
LDLVDQGLGGGILNVQENDAGVLDCESLDDRRADAGGSAADDDQTVPKAWVNRKMIRVLH